MVSIDYDEHTNEFIISKNGADIRLSRKEAKDISGLLRLGVLADVE